MIRLLLEVAVILVLLVINGVFAMSEIAMFSAKRLRLQQQADEGDVNARTALELIQSPVRFLSTVQIGITLVGIIAAAFSGATITEKLARVLSPLPTIGNYSEPIALVIVVIFLTFLSLLIGELIPKQLALSRSEQIATALARPMKFLSRLASPAVTVLETCTKFSLKTLGVLPPVEPEISVEEIQIMIDQGKKAGVVEDSEHKMVERVFGLDERRVAAIMTPRNNVVWIDVDEPPDCMWESISSSRHSYFPVCRGDLQSIAGIISLKDFVKRVRGPEKATVKECLFPPLFVPPSMSALKLLEFFKQTGRHFALVTDEYGTIDGLVTVTDVLEAIVGDIPSTGERQESYAVRRQDGSWLIDGMMAIDEFKRLMGMDVLPGEDDGYFHTVGGFVVTHLGRIPSIADRFDWGGHQFEIVDMDGRRVDKVLVVPKRAGKQG